MSQSKDALLESLRKYEKAYYSGNSIISDEEYDLLKAVYVEQYGEYEFVPDEGVTHFTKTKHLYPLKSLDKYQISEGVLNVVINYYFTLYIKIILSKLFV